MWTGRQARARVLNTFEDDPETPMTFTRLVASCLIAAACALATPSFAQSVKVGMLLPLDPDTREMIQNIYIRKVERQGGNLANVEFETIPQVKDPWKVLNPQ
jgi:hypothetical protein